jgi:Carboxypeptidase regulatory-like domain
MFVRSGVRYLGLAICGWATLSMAPAHRAAALQYVLTGTVVDRDGNPLADADIALMERDSAFRVARADGSGRFRLDSLPRKVAMLRVRHVGFRARLLPVDLVPDLAPDLLIALERSVNMLDTMQVEEEGAGPISPQLGEFYARARSNHFGHFIDERQLGELLPQYASDALRGVPGVTVRPSRRLGNEVRIRGCAPLVWVGGMRAPGAEVDDVARGNDVAALEVYSSLTGVPPQYSDRSATCGTILVWLKMR